MPGGIEVMKKQERNMWDAEKQELKKRRRKIPGKDPRDVNMK